MAFKAAKKTQERKCMAASHVEKAHDGGAETEETELLSPAMTKAKAINGEHLRHDRLKT